MGTNAHIKCESLNVQSWIKLLVSLAGPTGQKFSHVVQNIFRMVSLSSSCSYMYLHCKPQKTDHLKNFDTFFMSLQIPECLKTLHWLQANHETHATAAHTKYFWAAVQSTHGLKKASRFCFCRVRSQHWYFLLKLGLFKVIGLNIYYWIWTASNVKLIIYYKV